MGIKQVQIAGLAGAALSVGVATLDSITGGSGQWPSVVTQPLAAV